MLVWSKYNNEQLLRIEQLIEEIYSVNEVSKIEFLNEIEKILENKTLDLNNEMETLQKPLIVTASIWSSKEIIELLLKQNIDINKTINFFQLYGEDEPSEYCKNENVNCLIILYDKQLELQNILNENVVHNESNALLMLELSTVTKCIFTIENYLNDNLLYGKAQESKKYIESKNAHFSYESCFLEDSFL